MGRQFLPSEEENEGAPLKPVLWGVRGPNLVLKGSDHYITSKLLSVGTMIYPSLR